MGRTLPPGAPLNPFFGYRTPPRTFDYSIGVNTQVTPRWDRISFTTLKALWEAYDVAQICTRHLINDVRSLDYHFEAKLGIRDDVSDDILKARRVFRSPDKRLPFRAWLAKLLTDTIRYDAGALYIRRNMANEPIALEVVSGPTMIPLVDYYGRLPTDENDEDPDLTAAGTFHGKGDSCVPADHRGNAVGLAGGRQHHLSAAQPAAGLAVWARAARGGVAHREHGPSFPVAFPQYFTEGSIPQGFMEAPPDLSNADAVAEWQDTWDAMMQGDQAKLRQIRWVPAGAKYTPVGPATEKFDSEFPLYLMRRTCAAHGITPADLGFTETVNKATSETQVDVQFRVGTMPMVRHVEELINLFLMEHLKLQVRLRFDTGREIEDRLATAQSEQIYIDSGVSRRRAPDADRLPDVDDARHSPLHQQRPQWPGAADRARLSRRNRPGDIRAGEGRAALAHPFIPVPGVMPPIGSQDAKDADNSTAATASSLYPRTWACTTKMAPTAPAAQIKRGPHPSFHVAASAIPATTTSVQARS